MFFGGPCQNAADLIEQVLAHAACLHDVRLLPEVLSDELTRVVQRLRAILVERADDELWPVDLFDIAARPSGAGLQMLHSLSVVDRRYEIVEKHPVRNLSRQLHHLHTRRTNVDRNVFWRAAAMHDIDFDILDLNKFALECYFFHRKQAS